MHEVALAQSIFDIATETAKKNKAGKIIGIRLRIGELSCVNLDSLQFAFACISSDTLAQGAKLSASTIRESQTLEIESIEVEN